HGPGGAPGTAVSRATKQPVDLRTYVQSHGGKFPAADWLAVIADTRPASLHASVWNAIKKSQGGRVQEEAAARGVVGSIALYIISTQQTKSDRRRERHPAAQQHDRHRPWGGRDPSGSHPAVHRELIETDETCWEASYESATRDDGPAFTADADAR